MVRALATNSTRVFISGAAGLVGSHAVEHLLSLGFGVTALVRKSSSVGGLERLQRRYLHSLEVVVGDVCNQILLTEQMKGCDAVIHAAACIDPHGDARHLHDINVGGTRSALYAASKAQVKHFLLISSLSVIMGEGDCYGVTEETPLRECREAYANSKIAAERLVMAEGPKLNLNVTALRPGFIYGPGERSWLPRLISNMRKGTAMLVDDGSKETNLIYVGNLCRAIELSLLNPRSFGQVYNLTDGERVSKKQLYDTICDGLKIPRVRLRIPLVLARILVEVCSALARVSPPSMRQRLSLFSRPALRLCGLNQGFDISRAERELGYTERISFSEAMGLTLRSFSEYSPPSSANLSLGAPVK